ncbi:MAG: hypothetical protein B7Y45_11355 [Sphingomonas sp. 28-66-16]|nr:MAG: hypothetical protein B7Y45_11355 [Sphingomonas sp. 28-66-16]
MQIDHLFPAGDAAGAPYIESRRAVDDALALISDHGDDAGFEAAIRAERSRSLGNAIQFCHWRQIERLIVLMMAREVVGTRH